MTDSVNNIQSIKGYYGLNKEHSSNKTLDSILNLKKPKHVVFMCLDGLGISNLKYTPYLKSKLLQISETVYPSTTACATISLQTGLYPCEHGWIGWAQYFKEYDDIIELFSGYGHYSKIKYNIEELHKDISFKPYYIDIVNNKEFFPSFKPNGYNTLSDMLQDIKNHINSNETSFSYAYWDQPDTTLHQFGSNDVKTKDVLSNINSQIESFVKGLSDTIVIITSDHGHIDCEEIVLSKYNNLINTFKMNFSIEPRCTSFFIKEDMYNTFEEEFKQFEKYFILYKKEEFIKSDLFNKSSINKIIYDFLGDYIAVAKDKYAFLMQSKGFKSHHAGITKDEMEIPLIIIDL